MTDIRHDSVYNTARYLNSINQPRGNQRVEGSGFIYFKTYNAWPTDDDPEYGTLSPEEEADLVKTKHEKLKGTNPSHVSTLDDLASIYSTSYEPVIYEADSQDLTMSSEVKAEAQKVLGTPNLFSGNIMDRDRDPYYKMYHPRMHAIKYADMMREVRDKDQKEQKPLKRGAESEIDRSDAGEHEEMQC